MKFAMQRVLAVSGLVLLFSTVAMTQDPVPASELSRLEGLVGEWKISGRMMVTLEQWSDASGQATIRAALNGKFLEERYQMEFGNTKWDVICLRSWDPFQRTYRVGYFDNQFGLFDVYEGLYRDGELLVSNVRSNTFFTSGRLKFHTRNRTYALSRDSFKLDWYGSLDGGQTWFPAGNLTYTRTK
jgi:hypothetical protein